MRHQPIPQPSDLEAVRDSYNRVADNYVDMVTTTGVGDIRAHPWLKAAIDAFADTVAGVGPVLDVGCGPGAVTAYLAERGVDVQGVDLSSRMIEHARRLHPHCAFAVASATELDLADASLGGVLGWWSLFNLPRDVLPDVLGSFARALRPGGQVIVATHVGDDDVMRTEAYGGVPGPVDDASVAARTADQPAGGRGAATGRRTSSAGRRSQRAGRRYRGDAVE